MEKEYVPVAKRTRHQRALETKAILEKNKRARIATRNKYRQNRSKCCDVVNNDSNSDGSDEIEVVDENVYLRWMSNKECGVSLSPKPDVGVEECGVSQSPKPDVGVEECGTSHSPKPDVGVEEFSDDSIQFIGERWNPSYVDEDEDEDDNEHVVDVKLENCGMDSVDKGGDREGNRVEKRLDFDFEWEEEKRVLVKSCDKDGDREGSRVGKRLDLDFDWEEERRVPVRGCESPETSNAGSEDFTRRKRGRPRKNFDSTKSIENGGKRRRGRPRKNSSMENKGIEFEVANENENEKSDNRNRLKNDGKREMGTPELNCSTEMNGIGSDPQKDLVLEKPRSSENGDDREMSTPEKNCNVEACKLDSESQNGTASGCPDSSVNCGKREIGSPEKDCNVGTTKKDSNQNGCVSGCPNSSVIGGDQEMGSPEKNRTVERNGEESEPQDCPVPKHLINSANGGVGEIDNLEKKCTVETNAMPSVPQNGSIPVYLNNSENGGNREMGNPEKKCVMETNAIPSDSQNASAQEYSNSFKNDCKRERDSPENKCILETKGIPSQPQNASLPEYLNNSKKGGNRKMGSPEKKCIVETNAIPSEPQNGSLPEYLNNSENGCKKEMDSPEQKCIMEADGIDFEFIDVTVPEYPNSYENGGKRKRGRPRKDNMEIKPMLQVKKESRSLVNNEVEKILLNTISENGKAGSEASVSPKCEAELPLKFRFGSKESLPMPVKPEEEQESEDLFEDLDFTRRACDLGSSSFMAENDDSIPCNSAVLQYKLCSEGKHNLIQDDEIGIRCKFCSFVELEIKHVMPAFDRDAFGRPDNRNSSWFRPNDASVSDRCHLSDLSYNSHQTDSDNVQGTVWDLIPGIKPTLYPHQREGFEFMWKNTAGSIKLDELGEFSKFGHGGCIICHAPGTGKTRLSITFLQSFIRRYPMSKPVIIAPKSMLLTWEEELDRWKVDVPFINMNKTEFSGNEDLTILKHGENVKDQKNIRLVKLCTWSKGKGILGISYTLFEKLAGDREGVNKSIRRALIEQAGIMVLDEGHTPRNDQSNIWNVLSEVETKRRIILSGTPFQNNFEELHNTISLVREEFGNPLLQGNFAKCSRKSNFTERRGFMDCNGDDERRILELKKRMKPFVHVHKGEILKKTLRGLFHSILLLKPSDLQKVCFQQLKGITNRLKLDNLVSIASVHPSILCVSRQVPPAVDKILLKAHRADIDAGVKIRFLLDLIKLAKGEKVLVFSQFLHPLTFIRDLLKSKYRWSEGIELLYMDGKQDVKLRQSLIRLFNDPGSKARVLLASTKACSEGIHLVGASRVVLLDVVWNPSVERQAISRAYRLGQQKDVYVYHLITSGTYEEEKYYWQMRKDRMSEKVFSSDEENSQKIRTQTIFEDRILEEMIQNEKVKIFKRIVYQPKADELIESFSPVNL